MAYLLPIGPYHPALDEPAGLNFEIEDGRVAGVEIALGYNHRGVEAILPDLPPHRMLAPIARLCGKDAHANSLAFLTAFERLIEYEAPERADFVRVIGAELERVASHFGNSARVLRLLGFDIFAARLELHAEAVRQLLQIIGSNRVFNNLLFIGGLIRSPRIDDDYVAAVERLRKAAYTTAGRVLNSHALAERCVGVGVVGADEVGLNSLSGPIARAANSSLDWRYIAPYAAYSALDVRSITRQGGDMFARLTLRLLEGVESLNVVLRALRDMPGGSLTYDEGDGRLPGALPANADVSVHVESPRGDLLCYIATDERGAVSRVRLRPPTLLNVAALPLAAAGADVSDVPAIVASLDYCFACADR